MFCENINNYVKNLTIMDIEKAIVYNFFNPLPPYGGGTEKE